MSGQAGVIGTERNRIEDEAAEVGVLPLTPPPRRFLRSINRFKRRLMLADLLAVLSGMALAFVAQEVFRPVQTFIVARHVALALASLPAFAVGAGLNRMYHARANERWATEVGNILKTTAVGVATILALSFAVQFDQLSRFWVAMLTVSVAGLLIAERWVARKAFVRLRESGQLRRRIVIVGTDAHAIGLLHTYERHPSLGYEVVGFVGSDTYASRGDVAVFGPIGDLEAILKRTKSGGVVVSLASVSAEQVNELVRRLPDAGYHVALSSSLHDIDPKRLRTQDLDGRTMIYVEPVIRGGWRSIAKRGFDIAMASLILLLTLPILLIAAIAIKLSSRGPVLFHQTRIGKDGQPFRMVKLRTMTVDAESQKAALLEHNESDGPLFKIGRDPRITRVGGVLRRLSIDELPQLTCVIRGSMSLVGPRPALPEECDQWEEELFERLRVLPGLTGLWQVSGRAESSFESYKRMDLYYVHNWSLGHDLKICSMTVGAVLTGRGAA